MTCLYLTSDLHDGHRNIGTYRSSIIPEIVDVETNRKFIRKNWRATKRDTTILVGDIMFAKDSVDFIKSLPGRKILVAGNHDFESGARPTIVEAAEVFDKIYGVNKRSLPILADHQKAKAWIQHTPMHPAELRNCFCIHGHIHDVKQDYMNKGSEHYDSKFINVNMDVLYPRTGKIMISADELHSYAIGDWLKQT